MADPKPNNPQGIVNPDPNKPQGDQSKPGQPQPNPNPNPRPQGDQNR